MQATITEWMFVCITIRTLSYPQRCSLPPFLPPLPLLSLPLPKICPLFIFFFFCSLSFLCPNFFSPSCPSSLYPRPLLRLLLLPSQGPFYPSSYTSVSPPLFPSSALSFRFFSFPSLHSPPVALLSFLCLNSPFSFLCTSSSSVPSPSSPSTALSFHSFFCSLSFLFPICYFSFPSSSAHSFSFASSSSSPSSPPSTPKHD